MSCSRAQLQRALSGTIGVLSQCVAPAAGTCSPAGAAQHKHRLEQWLEYNATGGKQMRALLLLDTYRALQPPLAGGDRIPDAVLRLAWMHELVGRRMIACRLVVGYANNPLQAVFLTADDMMDGAHTRRGRTCWHERTLPDTQHKIGLTAINDVLMLDSSIAAVIERDFGVDRRAAALNNAFHRTRQLTTFGQMLDTERRPVDAMTPDAYADIVRHKTAHYSFVHPIQSALICSDRLDLLSSTTALAYRIGHYFQAQDDFLDCYVDGTETGKTGQDIENGKCTWLAVNCLPLIRHTDDYALFKEHYGGGDCPASRDHIRAIYDRSDMRRRFVDFDRRTRAELTREAQSSGLAELTSVLTETIERLAGRSK